MKAYIVDQIVLHSHCLPEHSVPDLRTVHYNYTVAASSTTEVRLPKYFQRCQARMWLLFNVPHCVDPEWELAVLQLLANRHRPVPCQKTNFTLVGSLARKQKITRENGSACNCSFTSAASPSIPLRKSTGLVAPRTRICPGGISTPLLMR